MAIPIVPDHWYTVRIVWNSNKSGGIPGDIFVDDQGPNGNDAGENWSGYKNATDADQSQLPTNRYLFAGDEISPSDGDFTIGANVNNHGNNVFEGLIDWIGWDPSVDYSGVDRNLTPVLTTNTGLAINKADSVGITNAELMVTDIDNSPAQLIFTVVTAPVNGALLLNGVTPINANDTFTQDDIDNYRLSYKHDGSTTSVDSFDFSVSDSDGGAISTTTFSITINP